VLDPVCARVRAFPGPGNRKSGAAYGSLSLDPSGEVFAAGCNPCGTSYISGHLVTGPDASALDVARYQGQRLARYATVIAEARSRGAFAARRPSPETFHGATLKGAAASPPQARPPT
jgi:hypothetical protein